MSTYVCAHGYESVCERVKLPMQQRVVMQQRMGILPSLPSRGRLPLSLRIGAKGCDWNGCSCFISHRSSTCDPFARSLPSSLRLINRVR